MTQAYILQCTGGPEVLKLADTEVDVPANRQVRISQTAIGVNYIDVYHRRGLYPQPLPFILGVEAAGVVEGVGAGVYEFEIGDRVAYALELGAYSQRRIIDADRLIKLPPWISDEVAAATLLKGLTVEFLIRRCRPISVGERVLVHAAAGGVGSIAVQWLKALGAIVIATASADKLSRVEALGADFVVNNREPGWSSRVLEVTEGVGVDVVLDGVGGEIFLESLNCLRRRGLLINFGNAAGPAPPISPLTLMQKGSLFLTRPSLYDYIVDTTELRRGASALFDVLQQGVIEPALCGTYPFGAAAHAHHDLESGRTVGSIILTNH